MVIGAKNPKHVMDFISMSWCYSHPLQQSTFYGEGNCTNNHIASALTVSKMFFLLNFPAPHSHRDRGDDFTELFLKEKYLGCMLLCLATASWMSQLKYIACENVSVIYLITLKLGADLFAVTMFVEFGAASLSPILACWMCMKLQTSCL